MTEPAAAASSGEAAAPALGPASGVAVPGEGPVAAFLAGGSCRAAEERGRGKVSCGEQSELQRAAQLL